MQRNFSFSDNEYYHLYNRGNSKQKIFLDKDDYERFLVLLYISNGNKPYKIRTEKNRSVFEYLDFDRGEPLVDICAYCLMPNHFHILVQEKIIGGIPKFMQKIMTGYSMYFNKKHERTGKLYENTFKAEHASTDNYLKYLFSYIHLNPVKLVDPAWKINGIRDFNDSYSFLKKYEYSSYLDYVGIKRKRNKIINIGSLPEYFVDRNSVENEIFDWLDFKN